MIHYYVDMHLEKNPIQIRISPDVIHILSQYDWPGNVRELINVLERLIITCPQGEILPEHLPRDIYAATLYPTHNSLQEKVEWFEYQCLEESLSVHITTRKTARALRMSQPTLVRKLNSYRSKYKRDSEVDQPAAN